MSIQTGAVIGAGTGALIARGAQGNLDGMQYTVEIGPGSQIFIVTDQTQVRVGDCVTVEQAKERLMKAETDEAFEVAMRRVNFLCDD
jgi:hypothetical protein